MNYLTCNNEGTPTIDRAGVFTLVNPVFDFTYRSPTHAIHIYEYDGHMKMNDRLIKFKSGDITCTPSGKITAYQTETPGRHWAIHFCEPDTGDNQTFKIPCHIPLGPNNLFLLDQFRLISRLFHTPTNQPKRQVLFQAEASFRLKALLLSLHNISFSQKQDGRRSRSTFVWKELLELIDNHLNLPVSTAWLAEKMNITPGTLSVKFKKEYGCTISEYVRRKKIDKAKSLLSTTPLTVHEVGSAVGISDPQYFNKQFRKTAGISPSQYRDENKEYLMTPPDNLLTKDAQWSNTEK